jgi:predicted ArsR family transcriptional regulator
MDRFDALGDRGARETLLYARSQPEPVTADEVADAHGVHRNVARSRLERLADGGLLIPSFERRSGRRGPGAGRPAKIYRVAPELSAIEFPERRYEELAGLLAAALPEPTRDKRLREIGAAFGRKLAQQARLRPAQRFPTALRRVCAAAGSLGYQASVAEVAGGRAVISTSTCPLRPLIRAHPDLRELDRGMWAGLVRQALQGGPEIECETHRCLDDGAECRINTVVRY